MTRTLVALSAFGFACREASDAQDESSAMALSDQVLESEGGYRGELARTGDVDMLRLDGKDVYVMLNVLDVRGNEARMDVSVRPGLGFWMIGEGSGEVIDDRTGNFKATVSDGSDLYCNVTGTWYGAEGLVDADLDCWNNDALRATYAVTVGRF